MDDEIAPECPHRIMRVGLIKVGKGQLGRRTVKKMASVVPTRVLFFWKAETRILKLSRRPAIDHLREDKVLHFFASRWFVRVIRQVEEILEGIQAFFGNEASLNE